MKLFIGYLKSRVSEITRSRLVRPTPAHSCRCYPTLHLTYQIYITDINSNCSATSSSLRNFTSIHYPVEIAIFQLDLESHRKGRRFSRVFMHTILHPGKPDSTSTSLCTAMASFEQTVTLTTCSDCEPQLV